MKKILVTLSLSLVIACASKDEDAGGTGTETDGSGSGDDGGGDDDGADDGGDDGADDGGDDGGDDGADDGGDDQNCVPGQSIECACPNGDTGAQICEEDGMSYGPCECEGDDTGSTGGTGTGSSGGTGTGSSSGTTGGGRPYRPCEEGCLDTEECHTQGWEGHNWCAEDCSEAGDCPDAPAGGGEIVCLPTGPMQPPVCAIGCGEQGACPQGMTCLPGMGPMEPSVCAWPP